MPHASDLTLGLLLLSGTYDRIQAGWMLASTAAAIGRRVVAFATAGGVHALTEDWSGLRDAEQDMVIQRRGVAGFAELRQACAEIGVKMIACEAALQAAAIDRGLLMRGVTVAGMATFLSEVGPGQIVGF